METITSDGDPLMYVVNYDEGGFVIVGATRDYYPVLAFSEEGSFDSSTLKGGEQIWMEETQAAIKKSGLQDPEVIASMNRLWRSLEDPNYFSAQEIPATRSTSPESACYNRCDELFMQYGGQGWNFLPLSMAEDIFMQAGQQEYYEQLCYSAQANNSSPEYSVVGWKDGSSTTTVGPLLETQWHQDSPFKDLCNGYPAGCAAIALAQVMKYHKYPALINHAGTIINMQTMPSDPQANSQQKDLISYVGAMIDTHYANFGSWTTPSAFVNGIQTIGYTVTKESLSYFNLTNEIIQRKRPVIMLGNKNNQEFLPSSLEYVGNSHYWVCDGARETTTGVLEVFTELQPGGNGIFTSGWGSINNPEVRGGVSQSFYRMNWGWGSPDNNWYSLIGNSIEYKYSLITFYLSH